jgi:hypothetical protein
LVTSSNIPRNFYFFFIYILKSSHSSFHSSLYSYLTAKLFLHQHKHPTWSQIHHQNMAAKRFLFDSNQDKDKQNDNKRMRTASTSSFASYVLY